MAVDVDALTAAVEQQTTVVDSVVEFVTQLKAQLDIELTGDPAAQAKVDAAIAAVLSNQTKLADAMVANTPNA